MSFTTDLKLAVANSLVIILAVGTPSAEDGSADISAVLSVAGQIASLMDGYRIIVTKSTVPVGTYKKVTEVMSAGTKHPFDYVSNPEFLKEGAAIDDFTKPDRVIIGTENPAVMELMRMVYAPFMRKSSRIMFMDPASAEITKYAANTMLATRISLMNELSCLCDRFGANIENVRAGIGSDSRIGSSFLFPGIGYGGSCFPKDVRALIYMGQQQNCPMLIAEAVQQANYRQQDNFADRILEYFKGRTNVTLGVWGLAFKAKTDDVRESPAIRCIEKFLSAGIKINAYDPEAMAGAKTLLNGKIQTREDSYSVLDDADALVVFTDWQEFRAPDFDLMAQKLKSKIIFDGRNLYEANWLKKLGFTYFSVGRP